jgi:membrane protein
MKRMMKWISQVVEFITVGIWRIPLQEIPRKKSFFIKQLRIFTLASKGFTEGKVQLKAASLTLYSILSVVPVMAMIFGISKGFGIQDTLKEKLLSVFQQYEQVEGHHELVSWVLDSANNFLSQAKGGFIAGAGLVLLFWSVMKVLGNIESSFNDIWQIKKSRTFARKFSDYLAIMLIAPVFIFLSSSVTYFITGQFDKVVEIIPFLEHFRFLLGLVPYILIWLLLTIIYMVMPNTRVNFSSALIAGIIAGTMFQFIQWIYMEFQIGINRYGAIYGSFAAIPLFIIWLQLSWVIVLIGAEISFANQNVDRYEFETESHNISYRFKRLVTLLIANLVIRNFANGESPYTATQISQKLKVPIRVIREIIYELIDVGIFSETFGKYPRERTYQPAMDINLISVDLVMKRLEERGSHHITVSKNKEYQRFSDILDSFDDTMKKSPSNMLLKDI